MKYSFKLRRIQAGLKQVDVAHELGVRQTTVSMWETDKSLPRTDLLPRIAKLYGCTVGELLISDEKPA